MWNLSERVPHYGRKLWLCLFSSACGSNDPCAKVLEFCILQQKYIDLCLHQNQLTLQSIGLSSIVVGVLLCSIFDPADQAHWKYLVFCNTDM